MEFKKTRVKSSKSELVHGSRPKPSSVHNDSIWLLRFDIRNRALCNLDGVESSELGEDGELSSLSQPNAGLVVSKSGHVHAEYLGHSFKCRCSVFTTCSNGV